MYDLNFNFEWYLPIVLNKFLFQRMHTFFFICRQYSTEKRYIIK